MIRTAPIILFVYNRPLHTQITVDSLLKNPEAAVSDLYIFSDGPKPLVDKQTSREISIKIGEVRKYIHSIRGFRNIQIFENETNTGLADSIIAGVSFILQKFDTVIVLEDDLQVTGGFLRFMNEALDFYREDARIFSLGGYSPPVEMPGGYEHEVYVSYRCSSWGWATWKDRWYKVDWTVRDYSLFKKDRKMQQAFGRGGKDLLDILNAQMSHKINSWAIRWDYAHFKNQAYALKPCFSLVKNIGTDGSGIHCGTTDRYDVDVTRYHDRTPSLTKQIEIDKAIVKRLAAFYEHQPRSFGKQLRHFIARVIKGKTHTNATLQ